MHQYDRSAKSVYNWLLLLAELGGRACQSTIEKIDSFFFDVVLMATTKAIGNIGIGGDDNGALRCMRKGE